MMLILLKYKYCWNNFFSQTININTPFLSQFVARIYFHFEIVTPIRFLYPLSFSLLNPNSGFLNFSTINTWGLIILHYEDYPVCYRMFSSIHGLYSLDSNSITIPSCDNKNIFLGIPKCLLGLGESLPVESHCSNPLSSISLPHYHTELYVCV